MATDPTRGPPLEAQTMGNSDLNEYKASLHAPHRLGEWPRLIKSQVGIVFIPVDWVICEWTDTLEGDSEKTVQHNESLGINQP